MIDNVALIIDDDSEIVELLQLAIEATLGCKVITACNGEIGLYEAKTNKPDLIFLDWIMPEMSGLVTLEELKLDSETSSIPVYMVSRKVSVENVRKAIEYGAAGYFLKPIEFEKFCQWLVVQFPSLAESNNI